MILEIPHTKHSLECPTFYLDTQEEMLNKAITLLHNQLLGDQVVEVLLKTQSYNEVQCFGNGEMYLWNPKNQSLAQKYPSLF